MEMSKYPMTLAVRELIEHKVEFTHHIYSYVEKGGTTTSSAELGVDEHAVIKTLVMENEKFRPNNWRGI
jgi:prolyl-tRNA editing enzyme YbaK/EbsC (Cys-tRNA(Pro) deacylase)